jgi:hypothetical protein
MPMQPENVPATLPIDGLARDIGFRPSTAIEDGATICRECGENDAAL